MSDTGYRMLIKRAGDTSSTDIQNSFNVVLESMPDIPLEPKNIYTQEWYDQNGNDVYMPSVIKYKAAECKFGFVTRKTILASTDSVFDNLEDFIDFLTGKMFSFVCEAQKVGRQNVRFVRKQDDALYAKNKKAVLTSGGIADAYEEVLKFSLVFEINDPKTNITTL